MDLKDFSLLYPTLDSHKRHYTGADAVSIGDDVIEQLGLSEVINLKNSDISDFFTTDPEIIEYRLENFSDMLENPEIGKRRYGRRREKTTSTMV